MRLIALLLKHFPLRPLCWTWSRFSVFTDLTEICYQWKDIDITWLDEGIITKLQATIGRELVKTPGVAREGTIGEDTRMVTTPWTLEWSINPMLCMAKNVGPISITRKKSRISHGSYPLTGKHDFCWPLTARNQYLGLQRRYPMKLYSPIVSQYKNLSPSLSAVRATLCSVYVIESKARCFESWTELQNCRVVLR